MWTEQLAMLGSVAHGTGRQLSRDCRDSASDPGCKFCSTTSVAHPWKLEPHRKTGLPLYPTFKGSPMCWSCLPGDKQLWEKRLLWGWTLDFKYCLNLDLRVWFHILRLHLCSRKTNPGRQNDERLKKGSPSYSPFMSSKFIVILDLFWVKYSWDTDEHSGACLQEHIHTPKHRKCCLPFLRPSEEGPLLNKEQEEDKK